MTAFEGITYFAVLDPQDPARVTYWRLSPRGLLSWPPEARYGPQTADGVADIGARFVWTARVFAAIAADPYAAAARFSVRKVRCVCCSRPLRDPASICYAIGPCCRADLPADVLRRMSEAVGRLHAASTSTWAEPLPFPVGEAA